MAERPTRTMTPADRMFVGLSIALTVAGSVMLVCIVSDRWLPWGPSVGFTAICCYGSIIAALLGLHLTGILWQWSRTSFTEPLPVFVCLCFDLLAACGLMTGLLMW